MSRLPRISGRECVTALQRTGFQITRQRGSHIVLTRDNPRAMVVVPNHRELDRGTLRAILRQTGLSIDEFLRLLQ